MNYKWFKIFNTDDFDALNIPSKNYRLNLEGVGIKNIFVAKGISYSITYDDIFLMLNLNDDNPFEFEDHAIYRDESNDVYLGIAVNES